MKSIVVRVIGASALVAFTLSLQPVAFSAGKNHVTIMAGKDAQRAKCNDAKMQHKKSERKAFMKKCMHQ